MKALLLALAIGFASAESVRSQEADVSAVQDGRSIPHVQASSSTRPEESAGNVLPVDPPTDDHSSAQDIGPSLFAENADEDPGILEIKRIARELESERALMIQIAGLQRDLIEFAIADPVAAWRSRIPSSVCEYALRRRFCDAMTSSFRKDGGDGR